MFFSKTKKLKRVSFLCLYVDFVFFAFLNKKKVDLCGYKKD